MNKELFEELDYRETEIGALSLRRRRRSAEGEDIFEIKLDEGYLMSSLFTIGEIALAQSGLKDLRDRPLDVVVGGLGLGYTAHAALQHPNVRALVVVEAIPEVIEWHERRLLPLSEALIDDGRCRFVCGDFLKMAGSEAGWDPEQPERQFDAVLVDIDHSPRHLLHPENAAFYALGGLRALSTKILAGGIFGLWSTDPPDELFMGDLSRVFGTVRSEVVNFDNPYQHGEASNTIYVARKA